MRKLAFLYCFTGMLLLGSTLSAQVDNNDLKSLNKLLESSLYKSKLSSDDGVILRQDDNGNTFEFHAEDVVKVIYDFDGLHNIIVWMKEGKKVKANVNGKELQSPYNVFTFRNKQDSETSIKMIKKIFLK